MVPVVVLMSAPVGVVMVLSSGLFSALGKAVTWRAAAHEVVDT